MKRRLRPTSPSERAFAALPLLPNRQTKGQRAVLPSISVSLWIAMYFVAALLLKQAGWL